MEQIAIVFEIIKKIVNSNKHRQEHGHTVYVGSKKATILDKLGQEVGHSVQVSQISNEITDERSKGEYRQHRTVEA